MENALDKAQIFSLSIILITSIFSIQISLKQVDGQQQQYIYLPDNKIKEQDDSLNAVTIVNNNTKNITDFFYSNIYTIAALILLIIFLAWSAKIVFGRADIGKPYFNWKRYRNYDSHGDIGEGLSGYG
jgi:hypothetical protein